MVNRPWSSRVTRSAAVNSIAIHAYLMEHSIISVKVIHKISGTARCLLVRNFLP